MIRKLFFLALPWALVYVLGRIHWLLGLLALLGLFWIVRRSWRRVKEARHRGDVSSYSTGNDALNWALALAHPMAFHSIQGGFADSHLSGADETLAAQLRPMVLHHLGMRTDLDDASIARQLPDLLRQRWFMQDLQKLHPGDDPRAAMAFACARAAFYVRCAFLLGWLQEDLHKQVLLLNARRAQQCFGSWLEFGTAYARGRRQWIAQGRADVLGKAVGEEEVAQWVADPRHPWHAMDWRLVLDTSDAPAQALPAHAAAT
ncbi:DUF1266 domain-containing protein [Comamonas terrae]|uniref:DUF1266 domain-containing protein n=1 Tax=Comamonas terrae TaxID=673548 RepID=A0ABW5ULS9_9BURK|nr:DUF1266 domain-containing protein [Comamonas terrae]